MSGIHDAFAFARTQGVGQSVTCGTCGKRKAPLGRSVAAVMVGSYCDHDCAGYYEEPYPHELWPGETRVEAFGEERS